MLEKYGQPDEYSVSQAMWYNNTPWKKIVVQREEVPHDFPAQHVGVLEQFIDYRVPSDKYDELAAYDGGVIAECTLQANCPVVIDAHTDPNVPAVLPPQIPGDHVKAYLTALGKGDPEAVGITQQLYQ
jgi:hypothetical protein